MGRAAALKDFSGVWFTKGNMPIIRALYDTLLYQDDDFKSHPQVAESWQYSTDGLALTVKLRQGVKFHSGREITSEDVKYSWKFATDEKVGMGSQLRQLFSLIKDVATPDKYTAEFKFDKPNPLVFDALDTLALHDQSVTANIAKTDAGSGPFKVKSYVPNADIVMERFDGYWQQGKPYLDGYVVKQIPDSSTLVVNLETGIVEAIEGAPLHEVPRLKAAGYMAVPAAGAQGMFHFCVNVRKERGEPWTNKKVRQALNYALDRERIVKTVLQGTAESTCLMWPKGSWGYFADLEGKYKYDLDKAKALLAEAGYANGFEAVLLVSQQHNAPLLPMGQIIQADLAKIGIKAKIEDVEATVYVNRYRTGEWDIAVHNYGRCNRDPGTMLAGANVWYTRAENGSLGFESADYEAWRNEAATILDTEKRKALYRKIQEWVLDECPSMAIAPDQTHYIYKDYVKDLRFTRETCPYVGEVWLNK
ncbi:MAG: ABC transporter substrate-binding protein [Dehalococcoidales bacterium]|nr:ABC transporter substrate-binding protein [Dehalococcoidales bacterium]